MLFFLDEVLLSLAAPAEAAVGFFSFLPFLFFCKTFPGGFGAGGVVVFVAAAAATVDVLLFFFFVFFFSSGGGFA